MNSRAISAMAWRLQRTARVPYFHVLDGTNHAGELHSRSTADLRHRWSEDQSALPKTVSSTVAWLSPQSPLSTRKGALRVGKSSYRLGLEQIQATAIRGC